MSNKTDKSTKAASNKNGEGTSKTSLFIGIGVLVVVLVLSTVGYQILAPDAQDIGVMNAAQESSAQSSSVQGGDAQNVGSAAVDAQESAQNANKVSLDLNVVDRSGTDFKLNMLEGKPIVLNFWASVCGPCRSEMPYFQTAYAEYGDEIHFVMVDVIGFNGETEQKGLSFLEEQGFTFPAYFDSYSEATQYFGLSSLPRTYFIDADGNIQASAMGAISESGLMQGISIIHP